MIAIFVNNKIVIFNIRIETLQYFKTIIILLARINKIEI